MVIARTTTSLAPDEHARTAFEAQYTEILQARRAARRFSGEGEATNGRMDTVSAGDPVHSVLRGGE
jgi:hypothetical protein